MSKSPWKECKCGVTTDPDQEKCPERGLLEDNPKHQLRPVELSDAELTSRIRGGKVYARDHSRFESLLKGEIVGPALLGEKSPP